MTPTIARTHLAAINSAQFNLRHAATHARAVHEAYNLAKIGSTYELTLAAEYEATAESLEAIYEYFFELAYHWEESK